jgi:glycosyltransferase involved in cell wall biosynthesis
MCFFYSLKHLRGGDTLLCIDLETALLGLFAAKLRGARVHYDMADPFYLTKPVPLKSFWRWLESKYISMADLATAPHASRFDLFFDSPLAHARVVENVPDIRAVTTRHQFQTDCHGHHVLTLGYFGTLGRHRGIEDLLSFVQHHPQTRLKIGGLGPLQEQIEIAARQCPRVHFVGAYQPEELASLTRDVDVYCSLYYSNKPLHRFAAPNKYYEHLALGIPILISDCTPNATDVLNNGTGWVISDGRQALDDWYKQVRREVATFERFARRAGELWSARYADWLTQQQHFFAKA